MSAELLSIIKFQKLYYFDLRMLQHKRAQTANPVHKQKHQETILMEIKVSQELQKIQSSKNLKLSEMLYRHHPTTSQSFKKEQKSMGKKLSRSPFARKLREIEHLNAREGKSGFSFEKDERRICQLGWNDFEQKIQRATHKNLQRIRKKAHQIKNKVSNYSIFTKNGVGNMGQKENGIELGEEKITDIWSMVKGEGKLNQQEQFIRISNLEKDIKDSYILRNAYAACLKSKKYKESPESSFIDQKLKSFVYLHQNENKLPKNKLNELLKSNYFLQ